MVQLNKLLKIIVILFLICLFSCNNKKGLLGEWKMIEWEGMGIPQSYDIIYTFYYNGEYTDSRSEGAIWNYEYYEPDSLILYHHGFYGERYKIQKNSNDTLIMQMKEYVFYGEENVEDFEGVSAEEKPIFIFLRQ